VGHLRENGTVSSQASATAGISAREAEVLTLVAQHLSNAEIGARLFISVRTVETHVSSLLRKLGVPDRRGLAQLAAELAEAERSGAAVARRPSPPSAWPRWAPGSAGAARRGGRVEAGGQAVGQSSEDLRGQRRSWAG
jgi:DNA-binding CsgD family transcriptional regulator